jgi:hypothetical protein
MRLKIRDVKKTIRNLVRVLNADSMVVMVCPELMRVVSGTHDDSGYIARHIVSFHFWEDMRDYIAENGYKFKPFNLAMLEENKHADK